jgi:hypothetical protein
MFESEMYSGSKHMLSCLYCDTMVPYHYVISLLMTGRCFSPGNPVSPTNITDRHNIAEILLRVALNTITLALIAIGKGIIYISHCLVLCLF